MQEMNKKTIDISDMTASQVEELLTFATDLREGRVPDDMTEREWHNNYIAKTGGNR